MNLDWGEAKYWVHHCLLLVLSEKPVDLINQIKKAGMKVIIFNFLEIIHVQISWHCLSMLIKLIFNQQ